MFSQKPLLSVRVRPAYTQDSAVNVAKAAVAVFAQCIGNRDVEVSEINGPRVYHRQSVQNQIRICRK